MSNTFFGRRAFLILVISVFLMPFLLKGTRLTLESNRNDVKDWLPDNFKETQLHRWFIGHFPHEQFVLVSWRGRHEGDPGCVLRESVENGDSRLETFARNLETFDPDLEYLNFSQRIIDLLSKEGLTTSSKILAYDDLTRIVGIRDTDAKLIRDTVRSRTTPFKFGVLTGERLIRSIEDQYPEEDFPELTHEAVLKRLEGTLIGKDHSKTCLVVTLTSDAKGKNLRRALDTIRRLGEECGVKSEDIRMGGPPVDNVAIDIEGERTLYRLAGLSALVGIGLSWLCFRSLRLTFLVVFCGILAAGLGLSAVYWSGWGARVIGIPSFAERFATCDAILLSMPSLVYVLSISGAVHIVNYYHDSIVEHGMIGSTENAIRLGVVPCTLAAITTSIGLGSLLASDLVPINKFGVYSAVGVMGSLAILFFFLPACLQFYPSHDYVSGGSRNRGSSTKPNLIERFWKHVAEFVVRHNMSVALGSLCVLIFFAFGLPRILPSVKLMNMFDEDAEIVRHYAWLEEHLGPLVPLEVVVKFDSEKCGPGTDRSLNLAQRLRLIRDLETAVETELSKDVGGALSATLFAPPVSQTAKTARFRFATTMADRMITRLISTHRDAFADYIQWDKEAADRKSDYPVRLDAMGVDRGLLDILAHHDIATLGELKRATGSSFDPRVLNAATGLTEYQAEQVLDRANLWLADNACKLVSLEDLGISDSSILVLESKGIKTLRDLKAVAGFNIETQRLATAVNLSESETQAVQDAVDKWRIAKGDELWRLTVRVAALDPNLDYSIFIDDIKHVVERQLDDRYRAPAKLDGYGRPILDEAGHPIPDTSAEGIPGISAIYTGLVPLVYKTQHVLLAGLTKSLLLAFVLIALIMMCLLRSPSAGLLSMVPNIFPVVVIFGFMGWTGILVDVGTMMTASVALGVAVDDTIHYLTWFRRGLDMGLDRKGAVMMAYKRCATAMTQTTFIGGLGLSVFMFSTFTPTQRFGVLMLTMLFVALIGDLIFLPAVLSGPAGWFFRLGKKKQATADDSSAESAGEPVATRDESEESTESTNPPAPGPDIAPESID